jgi:hypothetical protein
MVLIARHLRSELLPWDCFRTFVASRRASPSTMDEFVSKAPGQIAAAAFCSKSKSSEVILTVTEVVRFAMHLSCRLHPRLGKETRYNKKTFCAIIDANAGISPTSPIASREGLFGPPIYGTARPGYDRFQRVAYGTCRTSRDSRKPRKVRRGIELRFCDRLLWQENCVYMALRKVHISG